MDCVAAIQKLRDIRGDVGVNEKNQYLFALTQKSLEHANGWQAVHKVSVQANISNVTRLTATKMRHRASTFYAMQDIPENSRAAFYNHMGHSKDVNECIYQSPLGIKEMINVGSYLQRLDEGELTSISGKFYISNIF